MKIIKNRQRVTKVSYDLVFDFVGCPGSGFAFPCDEKGDVFPMNSAAAENFRKCAMGEYDVENKGVRKYEHSYWEDAIGRCVRCRAEVILYGFTNTCRCGADYNVSGQLLAPRSQWGEETGESASDIVNHDYANDDYAWDY